MQEHAEQSLVNVRGMDEVQFGDRPMTLNGTINRTGILLVICLCAGDYAWTPALGFGTIFGALIVGLILALVGVFRPQWTPVIAPAYACLECCVLGGIVSVYNARYPCPRPMYPFKDSLASVSSARSSL